MVAIRLIIDVVYERSNGDNDDNNIIIWIKRLTVLVSSDFVLDGESS